VHTKSEEDASEKGPEMRSAVRNDAQHALLYGWAMQQARALRFYVSRSQPKVLAQMH